MQWRVWIGPEVVLDKVKHKTLALIYSELLVLEKTHPDRSKGNARTVESVK